MTTEFIGRPHDFDFLVGGTWHVANRRLRHIGRALRLAAHREDADGHRDVAEDELGMRRVDVGLGARDFGIGGKGQLPGGNS